MSEDLSYKVQIGSDIVPLEEREAYLGTLPPTATRVRVLDQYNQLKVRKIDDLEDKDRLVLDKSGQVIFLESQLGRPSGKGNIVPTATPPANAAAAQFVTRKKEVLKKDPIKTVAEKNPESSEVLQQVIVGLADEAASLAFERQEAEARGSETSQISIRRVNALKAIGDTWLKRKEVAGAQAIDFNSPGFRALFGYILETVKECMLEAGSRPELVETVFAKISGKVQDGWVEEAKSRMKKADVN
jgi:hypothetical protein